MTVEYWDMASKVFFCPLSSGSSDQERGEAGQKVLVALLDEPGIGLHKEIPLKVHFGEKGNHTYLKPAVYDKIIDLLEGRGSKTFFTETSVLYGGERFSAAKHEKLAHAHGFIRIPVVFADGENGEASTLVPVANGKHFKYAAIASGLAAAEQVLVISHFKGHMLAGFGGALKQLSMGFAAKGGKMAMHLSVKPQIKKRKCKVCKLCLSRCNADAILMENGKLVIDHEKCVGCGACFSICPQKAVSVFRFSGLKNLLFGRQIFREKLAEYAIAAHRNKQNIYLNFVASVAPGCDCEPRKMSPCVPDVGVFGSFDPVALDSACYDAVASRGKRFRGHEQLNYAEKIGIGSKDYLIVEI
ncbi:MAG: DUF362 domain-containing protein [Lentisphaerae bacterium]|nr:DUF362 domain-containing protein [Lentisphaerota bacterium]